MAQEAHTIQINSNRKSVEKDRKIDNSKYVYTLTEAIEETRKYALT